MRIISGVAKGRKLHSPRNSDIRPTSDRAREALFSILHHKLDGALVLDLFSGTGALGIESLSRGAKGCIFVDCAKQSLDTTYKNIALLNSNKGNTKIIKHDLSRSLPLKHLNTLAPHGIDIIFADPPYSKGLGEKILQEISSSSILSKKGTLIIEERFTEELSKDTKTLSLVDKRSYGEAAFWFYELKNESPTTT